MQPPRVTERRALLDCLVFLEAVALLALAIAESLQPCAWWPLGALNVWRWPLLVLLLAPRYSIALELLRLAGCIATALGCFGQTLALVLITMRSTRPASRLQCEPADSSVRDTASVIQGAALLAGCVVHSALIYTMARYHDPNGRSAPPLALFRRAWRIENTLALAGGCALAVLFALDSVHTNIYYALGALFAWHVFLLLLPSIEFSYSVVVRPTLTRDWLRVLAYTLAAAQSAFYSLSALSLLINDERSRRPSCASAAALHHRPSARDTAFQMLTVSTLAVMACLYAYQLALCVRRMIKQH